MEFNLNQQATRERLEEFAEKIKVLQEQIGFKVSARGWCYQLESERLINKDEFDKVESWINKCRSNGILPIDFTSEEEGRKFSGVEVPDTDTPIEDLRYWINNTLTTEERYTANWWEGEEYYIQMLVEKIDLKTLFNPVCEKYKIPIATSKGWSSMLQRAVYSRRFKEAEEQGLKPLLLYCIPKGELILNDKGFDKIESISPNNNILGKSGFTRVFNTIKRDYNGKVININATSILPFRVTPEHPIYITEIKKVHNLKKGEQYRTIIKSDWVDAKDVKVGDYISFPKTNFPRREVFINFTFKKNRGGNDCITFTPKKLQSGKLKLTKNLARLFGCYMGDGSYSGCPTITFRKGDKNIELYSKIIKKELGYSAKPREHKDLSIQVTQLTFGGTVFGRFLVENFGKSAITKKIPDFIFNAKPEIVKSFIKGYIDADGTEKNELGKIRISTASKGLALQLQLLILDKFSELVSLFHFKREGWTKFQNRACYQHDKYEIHLYSQTNSKILSLKHKGKVGRRKWFECNGNIYVKIISVKKENYRGEVFNFTTDNHTVCINNIVTHNCGDHDPDGLRISDFIRKNIEDLKDIEWEDGLGGYDPENLLIVRFGLDADFIEKHKLTWINNLITGSKKNLASPNHKNNRMPYVQDYIKKFGVRKCEANAIVPMPEIARKFVDDTIKEYLGEDAEERFLAKRQAVRDEVQKFRKKTGLDKSLKIALKIIENGEEKNES